MIRETHRAHPQGTVVAYSDNAAVMEGATVARFHPRADGRYAAAPELTHTLMKVETHNHPTAIAPFPGAATGAGGEIRDEGATGIGGKPKAGLVGFTVSDLRIPALPQPWESALRQAGAHRVGVDDHARRTDRRGIVQQRVRPAESHRLLPHVRTERRRRSARLSQADHDRRRRRQPARRPHAQACAARGHAADPARRPRHADRHGRRRGVVDGHGREHRRPRFRFGAARQRRDRAPRAGSDRPLLAARRRQSDPVDPRRRRGRPVERAARARAWRRRRRHVRPARDSVGRARHDAARDLVQRGAGALRAGDRAASRCPCSKRCARASAARSPWSAPRTRKDAWSSRTAHFGNDPVDVPLDVHPRQAAEDDARRASRGAHAAGARPRRHRAQGGGLPRAAAAGGGRQDVSRHDRRSHGGRTLLARSDGRPVAGAGRRRRGDADGLRGLRAARRWRWASARRSR